MSAHEDSSLDLLGDVASWVREFEIDGGQALAELLPALSEDESTAAIVQLVALCSLALQGTGGREPIDWLTRLIEDLRRQSRDV
jgi:hypothetical protein